MNIEDDIKCLAESLLEIPQNGGSITTEIYSVNYTSRHPDSPFYQNSNSVQKMIDDGVLNLIESGEDGQPSLDASVIHYFANYKVSFIPENLESYLDKLKGLHKKEIEEDKKEIYQWRDLTLNLSEYTLKYKDKPNLEISLTREIKLLRLLMQIPQKVIHYFEIAKNIGIYIEDEEIKKGLVDKSVALDVQKVKQDLIDNFLIPSGMPEKEARSLILNVRSSGYKLY